MENKPALPNQGPEGSDLPSSLSPGTSAPSPSDSQPTPQSQGQGEAAPTPPPASPAAPKAPSQDESQPSGSPISPPTPSSPPTLPSPSSQSGQGQVSTTPPPPPPPTAPTTPPPAPPPGGNRLERLKGLIRPLLIVGILVLLGFLAFTFLSFDFSQLPLIGRFLGGTQNVELTYWGLWEDPDVMDPIFSDFIEEYEANNPNVNVTINYEKRSFGSLDQYKETLSTRLSQGTGPDVFRIHNSWVEDMSSNLAPLPSSVLSQEDYAVRFYPSAVSSAQVGADIYAIPLEYDGLVLFYNKEFFPDGNVSEKIQTWEDFRREAVRLTRWEGNDSARGAITRSGAAFGTADNVSHSPDALSLLFAQSGINPLEDLDTQAAADALVFYTNFASKDRVWDSTLPFSINAFANGQAAMLTASSWRAFDILNLNPDIEFAAAPVPQLPGASEGGVHWATFWMEGVSSQSQNPEVAWALLEFMTREDAQRELYSSQSQERLFGEPYSLRSLASSLSDHEILGPLLQSAPNAVTSKTADASGNTPYAEALRQAIKDVLAGEDPADALETAQSTINQLEGVSSPEEQ